MLIQKKILVPQEAKGQRLDKFLKINIAFFSRTKISSLIDQGNILVNGLARKPSYQLKGLEVILLKLKEEKKVLRPFEFKVKIIYEDEDIIVVDKPTDLVVHPPQPGYNKTLVNALLYMGKKLAKSSELRPGIVHRLDKETSGVMVVAKNEHSLANLIEQFKKRKVEKEYRAICWGQIKKDQLIIDLPLARDTKNRLKMKISFLKSKQALTKIEVLQRLKKSSLLALKIFTGRMHQLRVHLKFLGYPIVGDKKYGIKDNYKDLFLHSYRLGFYHPRKNNFVEFNSSLPERFKNFIGKNV